ncbi:MAG: hypothetical protein HY821_06735 [Acidobacteria bacterium]|nr:hypothetical protein [Acidobacteriota bacterium]
MAGWLPRILSGLGCVLFMALSWAPLAAWVAAAPAGDVMEGIRLAVPDARRGQVLLETVLYAAGSSALAVMIGAGGAAYCWRCSTPLAGGASAAAVAALPFPAYLHALAWLPVFAALPSRGAGWITAGWVQGLALSPMAFLLVRTSLERMDARWIDAARVFGPDRRLLARVLTPTLGGAALAAFSMAFLLTAGDPAVASLFSRNAFAMEIFADFSATHDAARALWLSTPLILVGLVALEPLRRYWPNIAQRPGGNRSMQPLAGVPYLAAGAVLTVLPVLMLLVAVLRQSWPPRAFWAAVPLSGRDALTSAGSAAAAGLIALPVSLLAGRVVWRASKLGWWWMTAPLAAPGALAGAGLIWLWNRELWWTPYGTFWMLPLAALARYLPVGILVAAAWRSRLDPALLEAAAVLGPPWQAFVKVEVPLAAPGAVVGAVAVFALALAELPATLLISPPGSGTLSLRIYNYLHYGASSSVAALSLCLMAGAGLAACIAWRIWRRLA